jgi:hypothetical protein
MEGRKTLRKEKKMRYKLRYKTQAEYVTELTVRDELGNTKKICKKEMER